MSDLIKQLTQLETTISQEIAAAQSLSALEVVKINYLAKKGPLREIKDQLPTIQDTVIRKDVGQTLNRILSSLKDTYLARESELKTQHIEMLNNKPWIDISAPGDRPHTGHLHPITQLREYAEDIFMRMGFEIVEPYTLDTDFHVFEALNIPSGHPARDMWDTFWTEEGHIPITHTSAMQHRILKSSKPPVRAIVPGRCFRHEATDATHGHTFYQIEGVYVDKGISLSDLIGTLKTFLSTFYEQEVKLKIQPSYFPFVEPGLEVMIGCVICKQQDVPCSTCRNKRWIELVPAGPIHPNVLKMAGIDHTEYSGFAWGMGLDRLVMIKYGIEDIRLFHSGDLRFLEQF